MPRKSKRQPVAAVVKNTAVALAAIVGVVVLDLYALSRGIDGQVMLASVATIALVAGVKLGDLAKLLRK